jgi:CobQ-like glutamine amidotransferase family enzyme
LPGAGVFDVRSVPGTRRHIGNIVVEVTDDDGTTRTLVGFENHSGRTYLGAGARPLGRVLAGHGNNGEDGTEGAVYRNVFGCYMHGSLLPKNPHFADHLLHLALARRGDLAALTPLDDTLEQRAQRTMAERLLAR